MSVRRRIARRMLAQTRCSSTYVMSDGVRVDVIDGSRFKVQAATTYGVFGNRVEVTDRANVNPNDWLFSFEELHGPYPKLEVK